MVLGELKLEILLRVCHPLQRSHGNLELTIARCAGADCRDGSKPVEDSKSALFHMVRTTTSGFHFKKGQRVALAGRYDQKTLKLLSPKIFSSCVTKIAVRKFAI